MLTRALVRSVLAKYVRSGVDPAALSFGTGPHGKPCLEVRELPRSVGSLPTTTCARTTEADAPGAGWGFETTPQPPQRRVAFNLSNTASLIACAVVATAGEAAAPTEAEIVDVEVGVDVEAGCRKLRGGVDKLARRWLSAAEAATLAELPDGPERAIRFLQLWTLKEACVKAAGTGIGASPTPSFTVQLRPAHSLNLVEQLRATTGLPVDGDGIEIRMVDAGPSLPDGSYHFLQLRMDTGEFVTLCTLAQYVSGGGGGIEKLRVWQGTRPEQMQPTHNVTVVGGSLHACTHQQ